MTATATPEPTPYARALRAFTDAAYHFSRVWEMSQNFHPADEAAERDMANATAAYPKYLPSFDEFVDDLQTMVGAVEEPRAVAPKRALVVGETYSAQEIGDLLGVDPHKIERGDRIIVPDDDERADPDTVAIQEAAGAVCVNCEHALDLHRSDRSTEPPTPVCDATPVCNCATFYPQRVTVRTLIRLLQAEPDLDVPVLIGDDKWYRYLGDYHRGPTRDEAENGGNEYSLPTIDEGAEFDSRDL